MLVSPTLLFAGAGFMLATLTALVSVVWRLSTIASQLTNAIERLARLERKDEAHDAHSAQLAVVEQRLAHKRERIDRLEARIARIEDRQPTGSHPAVR